MSASLDYTSLDTWKLLQMDQVTVRLAEILPGAVDPKTATVAEKIFTSLKEGIRAQVFLNCEKLGLRGTKMFKAYSHCNENLHKFIIAVLNEDDEMIKSANGIEVMQAKVLDYTKWETWASMSYSGATNRLAAVDSVNIDVSASRVVLQVYTTQKKDIRAQVFLNCEQLGLRGANLSIAYRYCNEALDTFLISVLDQDEKMLAFVKTKNEWQANLSNYIENGAAVRNKVFQMLNGNDESVALFRKGCTQLELWSWRMHFAFIHCKEDHCKLIEAVSDFDPELLVFLNAKSQEFFPSEK